MDVSKKNIDTLLICDREFAKILEDGLAIYKEINILKATVDFSEAEKLIKQNPQIVVVIDDGNERVSISQDFIKFLNDGATYFIAVCKKVNEGFVMLKEGAQEMIVLADQYSIPEFFFQNLRLKIKNTHDKYGTFVGRALKISDPPDYKKIICIGSSTGGAETLFSILTEMPPDAPPILIVQHMPPVFTKLFADRLHAHCKMSAWEAKDGDVLKRGLIMVAPGDFQMTVERRNGLIVRCMPGEKVNGHAPSVDVLFNSVARVVGKDCVGVILTGMGGDGAKGLLEIRNKNAYTIGQDEESSIVYGMPKVAFEIGAVTKQVSLKNMAKEILSKI